MRLDLMKFIKSASQHPRNLKKDSRLSGKIKYKCKCSNIWDFIELLETRGKCPKCGYQLIKFNE